MTNSISRFKPTYLYIKQHSITRKLYLGKTQSLKIEGYTGSGTRWKNHIKYYGKEHIETLWYCLFYDEESIKEFALMCSEQWNIVKSEDWLNLIPENGVNSSGAGMTGKHHSKETKEKLRQANLGIKQSEETIAKRSVGMLLHYATAPKVKRTKEQSAKISAGKKGQSYTKESCPNCGLLCGINILQRHIKACTRPESIEVKIDFRKADEFAEWLKHNQSERKHPIAVCPHCGSIGSVGNMKRWHFDKCKHNDSTTYK